MKLLDMAINKTQELKRRLKKNDDIMPMMPLTFKIVNSGQSPITIKDAQTGWSYACINKITNEITATQYDLLDIDNELLSDDHWLQNLFDNPNSIQSWSTIIKLVSQWMYVSGDAYIWTPQAVQGVTIDHPLQMWGLPSNRIQIISSKTKIIDHYLFRTGSGYMKIPPREMIHIFTPLPSTKLEESIYEGVPGALAAAAAAITVEKKQLDFADTFFTREGLQPWVILIEDKMTEIEWEKFISRFNVKMPEQFRPKALLERGMKVQSLETNSATSASQMSNLNVELIEKITAIYGVPINLLLGKYSGSGVNISSTGIKTAIAAFRENTVRPILDNIQQIITRHFKIYDNTVSFKYKTEEFIDPEERRKQEKHDIMFGIRTVNEVRVQGRGYESNPDLDVPLILSNLVKFKDTITEQPDVKKESDEDQKKLTNGTMLNKKLPVLDKYQYWKTYDSEAEKAIEELTYIIVSVFNLLNEEINNNINAAFIKSWAKVTPKKQLDNELQRIDNSKLEGIIRQEKIDNAIKLWTQRIDKWEYTTKQEDFDLFDIDKWEKIIEAESDPEVRKFLKKIFDLALNDIDGEIGDTEYQKQLKKALEATLKRISEPMGTIDKELREKIKDIIRDNPLATEKELAKLLRQAVDGNFKTVYTQSRTKMIARTTTTFGIGESQSSIWKSLNFNFTWLTQRDGKVRDSHRKADGNKPDEKGYFKIGTDKMKHPASGTQAKENVNCRCVLMPTPK